MRPIALILILALVAMPAVALAQRQVEIAGQKCFQQPGPRGTETWCTSADGSVFRVNPHTGLRLDPRPTTGGRLMPRHPVVAAQAAAEATDGSGRYAAGGFGLGLLLGPIGWAVAGISASNSAVAIPEMRSEWSPHEQIQFATTYTQEVRSSRTTAALVGGVAGSVTAGILLYLLISSAAEP